MLYLIFKKGSAGTSAGVVSSDDVVEIAKADVRFHDVLYKASENTKLMALLNSLREQMYRYRTEYLKDRNVHHMLVDEHRQMYKAILDRDKDALSVSIEKHLDNQAEAVRRMIREQD